ncbi:MAG: glycoside hydrolase family 3 protein [Chloroflexota bacterium]
MTDPLRGNAALPRGDAALARIMLAFEGLKPPRWALERFAAGTTAGLSLFRFHNVESVGQVAELVAALQRVDRSGLPLLVAADQEGGQLNSLGVGTTLFPGNMALGAAGSPLLTLEVARAIGLECRAMGVTVDYAPACDLANEPRSSSLGGRCFGSEPDLVALHAAMFVTGLAEAGVAGAAKHFPGSGSITVDTHERIGLIPGEADDLHAAELVPFKAAIAAGVAMVMSAHAAVPALTGDPTLPATLAPAVMRDLLRGQLGFRGISITDALDMRALAQGAGQVVDTIVSLRAGVDVLLGTADRESHDRMAAGLRQAALRGLLPDEGTRMALLRVDRLRRWLARFPVPSLDVVGGADHQALARRAAAASITLVRDDAGLLPLRPAAGERLLVVTPRTRDLTPADTSSTLRPDLAAAFRAHGVPDVEAIEVEARPTDAEIAGVVARARAAGTWRVVVGTISAEIQPEQAALVRTVLATGVPTVTVSLRTPWDLAHYPEAGTHVCAWSVVPASIDALAAALTGTAPMPGRLPAPVPGLYAPGHRMEMVAS